MTFTPFVQTVGNATVPLSPALGGTGGPYPWAPGDDGFLGCNADPAGASGGGLLVASTAYLVRLPLRVPTLISNIWICCSAAGVGTSTTSFVWIVNSSGTVLAQSTSAAAQAAMTGTNWQPVAMSTPATIPAGPPFAYAVILPNLLTTQPTLLRMLNTVNNSPQAVANVSQLRWAAQAAFGSAVANVTLSSNTGTGFCPVIFWS